MQINADWLNAALFEIPWFNDFFNFSTIFVIYRQPVICDVAAFHNYFEIKNKGTKFVFF
jgi:hypothetical protein